MIPVKRLSDALVSGALLALLIIPFIAPLPAVAFTFPWQKESAVSSLPPPRPVVSEVLDDSPLTERSVPGVITAKVEVILGFQTLGRLVARHVDVGDVVKAGDLLAALDPDDLQGNVASATAALEAAEVRLRTAQSTAERSRELAKRNVTSAAQLEQVENALISAEAAYQQANSELVRARDAEGFANMNAPFAGVISNVYENAGAVVSAGAPVVKLSADDQLEATIDLPETALAALRIGDGFDVWSESDPLRLLNAHVRVIEPIADAATRTRRVRLSLSGLEGFRLGTLIRARPASSQEEVLTVPTSALIDRDGAPHVWIVTRNGQAASVTLTPVTTEGPVIGGRIVIISGLKNGDEVITRGVHSLDDGQAVGRRVAP